MFALAFKRPIARFKVYFTVKNTSFSLEVRQVAVHGINKHRLNQNKSDKCK